MKRLGLLSVALLTCCSRPHEHPHADNGAETSAPLNSIENVATQEDRTPLSEPKGPIDPKSVEAAGQVVQHYGALIEQHRSEEAEKLWSNAELASQMTSKLAPYPEIHLEIGKPGEPEGAAGSIYVTMPVVFYGKDQTDAPFRVSADVVLRRVNDVPGSSEAQRHWHVERIDWKKAG